MILLKNIQINSIESLRDAVQKAIELEHATIPPYLTANFTLANTGNDEISNLIGSVVGEEMLHLSIACNLLNAIGGSPVLNTPGFIPQYPGPLPGGVEEGLIVPIAKFSKQLIKDKFMAIEKPEDPIDIKLMKTDKFKEKKEITIGEFYSKIIVNMKALEDGAKASCTTIFTGDSTYQMANGKWFPEKELFVINDFDSAKKAIDIIIDQGEGTSKDPFVSENDLGPGEATEPAHYYRFEEIYKGKKLVKDSSAEVGYSYSGAEILYDPSKVPNMKENPKMNDYPVDSPAYTNSKFFNYNYTSLLNSLHVTFNGKPDTIDSAMGLMFAIRLYALRLLTTPDPNNPGYVAGPSFEYITDEDLTKEELTMLKSHKLRG
jgi:rubrerythrin